MTPNKVIGGALFIALIIFGGALLSINTKEPTKEENEKAKSLDVGDSAIRWNEIQVSTIGGDPCAGLELPGKYVPTEILAVIPYDAVILHFKGRVSQGHLNCIGEVAGVERAWIPAMTHYQIMVKRAELYSWDEIKKGIRMKFLDIQDGGNPAQTDKEK